MNAALEPFIVEGILILASAIFGVLLEKKGKPYGKVKLIFHLFFFLWLAIGYYFILEETVKAMSPTLISVIVMGVALLGVLVSGIMMLARKEVGKPLSSIHKVSAVVMLLADVWGLVIVALH